MAAGRLKPRIPPEHLARWFVLGVVLGLPLAIAGARWLDGSRSPIELRARLAEAGGWTPGDLQARVGEPLHLRLISDDVMHGFAVGQSDQPAIDVPPGQMAEASLTFDRPGKYVFYCTRWCGPGHWRMRGTIEVTGGATEPAVATPPLYVRLGIDVDAPHPANVVPTHRPSAGRGGELRAALLERYQRLDYYRAHTPAEAWQALRDESVTHGLTDSEVWDLVAWVWGSHATPTTRAEGQRLYAQNCAACHGESGAGDGVMAATLEKDEHSTQLEIGHTARPPTNFTDATQMLGASPALLQGKIIRGGMGTGMPYWGPIFTEAQTWALVDYLWTFQFSHPEAP